MKKNKIVILVILLLLLLIAGGCNSENATDESIRSMGFPSLSDVPGGFSSVDAKSIDTGDWCEITYENSSGDFLSLDCYESGTFDIAFLMNYAESTEQMTIKDKEATVYKNLSDNDNRINIIAWEDEDNKALCLLGGNVSMDEMVRAAESVKYDMKKAAAEPENDAISSTPQERGTIEETYLKKYSVVLKNTTKPLFDSEMENDKAISKIELESFYKSFDLHIADNLLVEVFDYDYFMKANDDVIIAGGMQRGEDGNIRDFTGSFGQIAAVSREGQLIKAVPLTNLDVKLEPVPADEESSEWIKGKVMASIKSPAYLVRNRLHY